MDVAQGCERRLDHFGSALWLPFVVFLVDGKLCKLAWSAAPRRWRNRARANISMDLGPPKSRKKAAQERATAARRALANPCDCGVAL
jgi:hypothetical protein